MSLLDPVIIAQLGNLELRARRVLDGFFAGHHLNRNRGHAQDFSEHRPYNPGDDLRQVDWKVFGRTDRLVIKQYEEQTNVAASVLLDHSNSMAFSHAGRMSKLEYAKTMAAAIGYVVVTQHDAIGLEAGDVAVPQGAQLAHLDRYFKALEQVKAAGTWDVRAMADELSRKRGFVVVFSDLMADEERVVSTLRMLQARKHEVMVFHVLDPAEIDLPFEGPVLFEDLETSERIKTEPAMIRRRYREWVQQKLASFSHLFRTTGVEYLTLTTDMPFDKGLGAYLSWRGVNL